MLCQVFYKDEKIEDFEKEIDSKKKKLKMLEEVKETQRQEIERYYNQNVERQNQLNEAQKAGDQLRKDLIKLEDEFNEYKTGSEDKQAELKDQLRDAKKAGNDKEKELAIENEAIKIKIEEMKAAHEEALNAALTKEPSKKSVVKSEGKKSNSS